MKKYSPGQVSDLLELNPATIRKYSIMLEEKGHEIERNSQNHRSYSEDDVLLLRQVIESKESDITLDEAVDHAVKSSLRNLTPNKEIEKSTDEITELKELIEQQNNLIRLSALLALSWLTLSLALKIIKKVLKLLRRK